MGKQKFHKETRRLLAQLEQTREQIRQDRRLSILLIKPFVLYQIWRAKRNLRAMLPQEYTYRRTRNVFHRRKP